MTFVLGFFLVLLAITMASNSRVAFTIIWAILLVLSATAYVFGLK